MRIITLARKPLAGSVASNVLEHGTGALHIEAARISTSDNLDGGAYAGILRQRGNYSASDTEADASLTRLNRGIGEFQQPTGRWPANLVLEHSPGCQVAAGLCASGCPVADLDEQSGITRSDGGVVPSGSNAFGQDSGWNKHDTKITQFHRPKDEGGASRFYKQVVR